MRLPRQIGFYRYYFAKLLAAVFILPAIFFCETDLIGGAEIAQAQPAIDHNDTDDALLNQPVQLGDEYSDYKRGAGAKSGSPGAKHSLLVNILLYLPNRLLDLIDIVKADVGVGPSYGAVVRVTSYGQVGYRNFDTWSLRAGLHGRNSPVFIERVKESGFFTNFHESVVRKPDEFEIGGGVDLGIAGAYVGFAPEQLVDFFGGLFGFDPLSDDL